jgi:hypothetical protein
LQREPSRLNGWHGDAREFSYLAEVQPVLNRRCITCHDYGTEAGGRLNLAPDRDLVFNTSYNELWRKKLVRVVGAGSAENQAARSWGSAASPLVSRLLTDATCGGALKAEELDRIVTWIDLNAPYYPSYASAYPDNLAGRSPLSNEQVERLEKLTGVPLRHQAGHSSNQGPQVSFDRPELSPCLAPARGLAPEQRAEALEIIRKGQHQLAQRPEADMPGFQPSEMDLWRNEKYLARQHSETKSRKALETGAKVYERGTD